MDFYVDLAVAVLLRLIKDRRGVHKYYPALAKVGEAIALLAEQDAAFKKVLNDRGVSI